MDLTGILHRVVPEVARAGEAVRAEFLRPGGPRGEGQKAPVDTEIELALCEALQAILPARFVGEETPPVPYPASPAGHAAGGFCWLVDPHDGTSEFLKGARGSSVSVALLHDALPVLGVVHAPLSPDRGSDLIAWAEGMDHVLRNGAAVRPELGSRRLEEAGAVVLLAYGSFMRPQTSARRVAPARFLSSNSIAYRLARVAAGDAVATVSRQAGLVAHDYAAGHALLRGAGGILVDGEGKAPVYGVDGSGWLTRCFAGAPAAVAALADRDWTLGPVPEPPLEPRVRLRGARAEDRLDRAIGCLAGLAIGEGPPAGGLVGQCGPGAELAIALARALAAGADPRDAYRAWPGPVAAVEPVLRCAPLALGRDPATAAALARRDAAATHTEPLSIAVCGPFAAAVAAGVAGGDRRAMLDAARSVADAVTSASLDGAGGDGQGPLGLLRRGFGALLAGAAPGQAGGAAEDATGGALGGALLGAAGGRAALPERGFLLLLTCRPLASQGARRPRPPAYWADDLPMLAEAVLQASRDADGGAPA